MSRVVTVAPAEHTIDVAELWPAVSPANASEVAGLQLGHHAAACQGWVLPRGVPLRALGVRNVRA